MQHFRPVTHRPVTGGINREQPYPGWVIVLLSAVNPEPMNSDLQLNVRLYPWFRMAGEGHAWIPVFFLYMSQTLSLDRIILLSSVYYLSVFLLEVPSGYFSDRVGRRATLLLAAGSFALAAVCFLIGGHFAWFAAGQFFLAGGFAMQSGTDTALLYDSLKGLGREAEYANREASAEQWGLIMLAVATFAGGALGMIDLRLAYLYTLVSALVTLALVWRFAEPRHADEASGVPDGFLPVVWSCLLKLRDRLLGWLFLVVILLYALAHFVFEFYQPYISLLDLSLFAALESAPLVSGIVISISMFGGALGARASIPWEARFGLVGLIVIAILIQLGIIGAMASVLSPLILVFIFARNFPMALVHAPVRAAIAPRVERAQRATYLSLQGLSDRLVFALLLLGLASGLQPGAPVDEPTLHGILSTMFWIGLAASVLLFLFVRSIARRARDGVESA